MSVCRKQIKLLITPPIMEIVKKKKENFILESFNLGRILIIPYPPSFNRIPAKIIDPETGASTWALGSHEWTKNIGILIKNPIIKHI